FGADIFDPPKVDVPSDTLDEAMHYLKLFSFSVKRWDNLASEWRQKEDFSLEQLSLVALEVPANGNVEFLVRLGDFVICIAEAKKSDFDQERAQNYVECEVVYELNGGRQPVVYGIVSNFIDWIFVRLTDEAVKEAQYAVSFDKEGYPDRADVEKFAVSSWGFFLKRRS
ncbi:967_t:CDS:2, partial [Paraglomus occultum]